MTLRSAIPILALLVLAPVPLNAANGDRIQIGTDVPNHFTFQGLVGMLETPTPDHPGIMMLVLARELEIDDAEAQELAPQIIEAGEKAKRKMHSATRRLLCSVYSQWTGDEVFGALTALQDAEEEALLTSYNSFMAKLPSDQATKVSAFLGRLKQNSVNRRPDHFSKDTWADSLEAETRVVRVCNAIGMDYGEEQ